MKLKAARLQGFALLLSFYLVLVGCGPQNRNEADCGFVQNVYGQRISWKDTAPVGLSLHESFPPDMLPGLQRAMDTWAVLLGRPAFKIVQTGYQSTTPRQDGVNVVYWLRTWETEKATEQARTSIYWVGDQIREADIRINDKNFNFFID